MPYGDALCSEDLMLQRVHRRRRLIDPAHERDRSLKDGRDPLAILDPRLRVLVLDDKRRFLDIERQQLAGGELMIEPVDRPILEIGERVVSCGARQLVFRKHHLLLPRVELIGGVCGGPAVFPVTPFNRLPAVAPGGHATRIDHLTLHVKARDQKVVAGVFQVLKHRTGILSHQDRMRRVVVNAKLIPDPVLFADPVQRDPGSRRVREVVVKAVVGGPAWHRTLFDTKHQTARLCLREQRHERSFELDQVLLERQLGVAAHEPADSAYAERVRRVEDAPQKFVLLPSDGRIVMEEIVKVGEIGERQPVSVERSLHPAGAPGIEWPPQVERVGHRVEHCFRRHIRFARVKGGGQLQLVGAQLRRERDPFLDRPVGIGVTGLARRQLL